MDWIVPFIILLVLAFTIVFYRQVTVMEYECGLLYSRGKFKRILTPGTHSYLRGWHTVQKLDIRDRFITLPGQEVLTADNISLKVSLVASFKVGDPLLAMQETVNYQESLYLILQINLRDIVGGLSIDDLLEKRQTIGDELFKRSVEQAKALGLVLNLANVKDIMFPGELKTIFARVVSARKEGLAALERARGESASLRNLANAAKLMQHNPELSQLRLLQTLENHTGSTIVLISGKEWIEAKEKRGKG